MDQRECLRRRESLGCVVVGCLVAFLVLGAAGSAAASDAPYRVCLAGLGGDGKPILPPGNISVPAGSITEVGVWIDPAGGSAEGIQRFELLLCYDANVLSRMVVLRRADLAAGWEYFTYRTEQPGQIRLVADGENHRHVIGHNRQLRRAVIRQRQVLAGFGGLAVLPGINA